MSNRLTWKCLQVFVLVVASNAVCLMSIGLSEDRREVVVEARSLVSEALHRRIYGLEVEHATLLARANSVSPNFAPAHWSAGRVRYMDKWLAVDDVTNDEKVKKRLEQYETIREKVPPTAAGYLALANWCAEHSLPMQERAHLFQVIDQAPNHVNARQRLGFVFANGEWIEAQTIWEGMYDAARVQQSLRKWQEPMAAISKGLKRNKPSLHVVAQDKLAAIDDPDAICALEQLASESSDAGQLVIDTISKMQEHEASAALARQAVFSPFPRVREQATKRLGTRPYEHYVPRLLAEMATPIDSRFAALFTRGRVLYRHVFFRESQKQNQVLVLDTRYRQVSPLIVQSPGSGDVNDELGVGGDDSGPSFGEAVMSDLQDTIQSRERQRLLQNAWIEAMNNRICHVLRQATGQQLQSKPQTWWQWWDQELQVTRLGQKQTNTKSQAETKTFVQPTYGEASPQQVPRPQPRRRCECFAAGTPVLTASGLIEIERLKVGDLVLAKHPDTGELAFRPVLATTVRPPEQVIKIKTITETIEATSGHPLWIDGEGWRMTRDLASGMALHGLENGVLVTDTKPGNVKQTYNLIVDEFHSYFVGFDHILAHDNTPCRPTNSVVPGLARLAN